MQQQLELRFWPRDWLWSAIDDYLKSRELLGRSEWTLDDYGIRAKWLLLKIGARTPLGSITYDQLEELARKHGPDGDGSLLYETLRQRFKFLRQVQTYAAKKKVISKADIVDRVELPKDIQHKKPVPSIAEFRMMRLALTPGRFRWLADFFMWTGHHNQDAWTLQWKHLDPDYVWLDDDGKVLARGRYWRRNQKNGKVEEFWFPMEPEFHEAVLELFAANPDRRPDNLVTGHVWNLRKTFNAACDRAGIPRFTPIRMRAAYARTMRSRYPRELVRLAMGHESHDSKTEGGKTTRVDVLERHYLGPSPDVIAAALTGNRRPPARRWRKVRRPPMSANVRPQKSTKVKGKPRKKN
jgi:integrase